MTTPLTDWEELWPLARGNAQRPSHPQHDCALAYLRRRGLADAADAGIVGLLDSSMTLPSSILRWPHSGYLLVAPLYDAVGQVDSIQARSIAPDATPKTLNPKGCRVIHNVFASGTGQAFLDRPSDVKAVLIAEGLTDMLALGLAVPDWPVLSAPGVGAAEHAVSVWARDQRVVVAMDCDTAGDAAVSRVAHEAYAFGAQSVARLRWPRGAVDACDALQRLGSTAALREFLLEIAGGTSWKTTEASS